LLKSSRFYAYDLKKSKKPNNNEADLDEALVEKPSSTIVLQNSQLNLLQAQLQTYQFFIFNNPNFINYAISAQFQNLQQATTNSTFDQNLDNSLQVQSYETFSDNVQLNSTSYHHSILDSMPSILTPQAESHSTSASETDIIQITANEFVSNNRPKNFDYLILQDQQSWLEGYHIDFALKSIKEQYPAIDGLDSVSEFSYSHTKNLSAFNYKTPSIFIFHLLNHWVTVSNISFYLGFFDNKKWFLYDSLSTNTHFERALSILKRIDSDFELESVSVQQQNGCNDCGVFAIANALSLCYRMNPKDLYYIQYKMRAHFNNCVSKKTFSAFPCTQRFFSN
jgi:hypothetical protein